jgi:IS5 family transposase
MFDSIGHRVTKLRRAAIGPLELAGLEPGEWRYLTTKEVRELNEYMDRRAAEVAEKGPPPEMPRREKRVETPADRSKRKVIKQAIAEAARKKEVEKEKAAQEARDAERKGPRQPKPAWKRGAKRPGKRPFPRTKGKFGKR